MENVKRIYIDADRFIYLICSQLEMPYYWVGDVFFQTKIEAKEHLELFGLDGQEIMQQNCCFPPTFVNTTIERIVTSKINFFKNKFPSAAQVYFIQARNSTNFRNEVDHNYKSHRGTKPFYTDYVREVLAKKLKAIRIDEVECDDAVAIFSTIDHESVLVSVDKDHKNVICNLYNPDKDEFTKTTEKTTLEHFIYQLIVGDTADNIKGLPKCGAKFVDKFFDTYKNLPKSYEELVNMVESLCKDNKKIFDQEKFKKDFLLLDMAGQMSERMGVNHPYKHLFSDITKRARVYLNRRFKV